MSSKTTSRHRGIGPLWHWGLIFWMALGVATGAQVASPFLPLSHGLAQMLHLVTGFAGVCLFAVGVYKKFLIEKSVGDLLPRGRDFRAAPGLLLYAVHGLAEKPAAARPHLFTKLFYAVEIVSFVTLAATGLLLLAAGGRAAAALGGAYNVRAYHLWAAWILALAAIGHGYAWLVEDFRSARTVLTGAGRSRE